MASKVVDVLQSLDLDKMMWLMCYFKMLELVSLLVRLISLISFTASGIRWGFDHMNLKVSSVTLSDVHMPFGMVSGIINLSYDDTS